MIITCLSEMWIVKGRLHSRKSLAPGQLVLDVKLRHGRC